MITPGDTHPALFQGYVSMKTRGKIAGASGTEAEILELCRDKFHWKTNREIDRVEELFDDGLIFVHLNGHVTTKREWIATMRSGTFVYRSIRPHELSAKVYAEAAVVFGKATFDVIFGGHSGRYELAFTEVYALKAGAWKLVNLHTCGY